MTKNVGTYAMLPNIHEDTYMEQTWVKCGKHIYISGSM